MSAVYWHMVAENIAKGLGPRAVKRIGAGGKFLGRAGAMVGIGFLAFELFHNYKENIENEPAFKEMMILQNEMEKWTSAISCLGRKPLVDQAYGSIDEGGAINALYDKIDLRGQGTIPFDSEEAMALTERAIEYILSAKNLMEDDEFDKNIRALVSRLTKIHETIHRAVDYGPIQIDLAGIVDDIKPIESGYSARIYNCSREIQKTLGSNAAWAAISMVTLGLAKKPIR